MSAARPHPREAPHGFHFEAAEDDGWITPPVGAGRCRYMVGRYACGKPAVATLMRPIYGREQRPWDYCADHMYGRWIENGKVMWWQLRVAGDPE